MPALTPYQRATREGVRAAQQEHQRLRTSLRDKVEIFDVIEDARIWLFFRSLRGLYGAYQRYADAAGIVINSQHPLTLQRYTAAHEYGHHVLGHTASVDDEQRINRNSRDPQEIAAQAFAGEFLMPLQVVNYTLRTMGLAGKNTSFTPLQVYQLALQLGVSYSAAVWQLVGQRKLTVSAGQRLRRESPLALKTAVAGTRPADSWADVWLLDESQEGREFTPRLRDEIHVTLAETPSTGYVWELVEAAPSVLALIDDQFETPDDDDLIGGEGLRHVAFRVAEPGSSRLRLEKRRPWQAEGTAVASFEATVHAIGPLTGDAEDGLSDRQKQAVLAGGRAA
jgi:Zn-dependent peptidase ImmA (M78 family)/predicted secreted protein